MGDPSPVADWTELCSYLTDIVKQEGFKQQRWLMVECPPSDQLLICHDSPSCYAAILKRPDGWSLVLRTPSKTEAPDEDSLALVDALVAKHAR